MTGDPEIIFTFDDGPDPIRTPLVLDALAKHHIHAVFFMVGNMVVHPKSQPIIDRILREGHIIANHTMKHGDLCRIKEDAAAAAEIDDGKKAIEARAGMTMVWFRAPYGVRCDRVDLMLLERGINHFHWDIDPREWKRGASKKTLEYLEKQLGKMTGRNVLLLHDIKKVTVDTLPILLDWLEAENARRKELRLRRIRIIQSYELAADQLPPGMLDWMRSVAPSRDGLAKAIGSVLP